jgi:hypothetical protein
MTNTANDASADLATDRAGAVAVRGFIGGLIAAVANVAVLLIVNASIDGSIEVTPPGSSELEQLTLAPVVGASIMPALVGVGFYLALRALAPARARTIFLVVAGVVTLASLGSPFGLDISRAEQLALVAMHIVAGASIALMIARPARP